MHTGWMGPAMMARLNDPDTLFVFAISIVAVVVAVGKLIERVFRLRDVEADKWM
jgi:DNA-binding MltR family transcriptional regulator